ncbi:hypothetical protein [Tolypothrix sp. VBCCA 56010]|uniref:hypothetical protein n=1 Tax=Tolypothrix sp. VBCCA 56010 TaxID=3137731 RepID=UPI003D7D39E0
MPNAPCPMPIAHCPMPHAPFPDYVIGDRNLFPDNCRIIKIRAAPTSRLPFKLSSCLKLCSLLLTGARTLR